MLTSTRNPSSVTASSGRRGRRRVFAVKCRVGVKMTGEMYDVVYRLARQQDVNISEAVRRLVARGIAGTKIDSPTS